MKTFLASALALTLALLSPASHADTDFPNRPIRMLVGFSAGSISDTTARLVAERAEKTLGRTVVVENVPGAGATLAAARAAKSPADGYTILFVAMGHAVAPALYRKLPYDTVNDFTGVATVADARVMLVTKPSHPWKDLGQFVQAARNEPGKYTFGSSGNGTFLHLIGESMSQAMGIKLLHVPYRSGSEVVNAVISGNVDLAFCTVNTCNEQLKAGRVKALGYIASQRHPVASDVPTFSEQGVPFEAGSYNYILAPAGTPAPVLQKLHAAFNGAVTSQEIKERFLGMGLEPVPSTGPDAVTAFMKAEVDRWGPVVRSIGLKVD